MAKIYEQAVVIKLSKLIKNNDEVQDSLISTETLVALEQVAQELIGSDVIVEVEVV
jgi:hypothetical protein